MAIRRELEGLAKRSQILVRAKFEDASFQLTVERADLVGDYRNC
jgi:hypothetical protein